MKKFYVMLFLLFSMIFSGCYFNKDVETNQMGVRLDRNAVLDVVGPGVYSAAGFFTDLRTVDVDTLTFQVSDPEVLTADNQIVGVFVTIQARRQNNADAVKNLVTNWPSLIDNNKLIEVISATAREGIKNGTRGFTLTTLLDDRNGLANAIRAQVELDAGQYSAELVNITIENIAIDPNYATVLNEKALFRAQTEKELQRQELILQESANKQLEAKQNTLILEEQLNTTMAQTAVDVEIATREGKKIAAKNEVYVLNAQAFELERLRLLKDVIGQGTVYFIPVGTDLTTFFSPTNNTLIPVPLN